MTNLPPTRPSIRIVFALALILLIAGGPASARTITDAAGRQVVIPDQVEHIMPAGPPAALVLYTLAPEKLLGWAHKPPAEALALLDPSATQLPELGAAMLSPLVQMQGLILLEEERDQVRQGDLVEFIPLGSWAG